ncbi:MAG: hypothetical protein ACAH17_03715 [Candidatus Paceibacterota bacterium]
MDSRLDDLAETSARHDENLKEHMKRSDTNEQAIEMLKSHVNMVNGIIAFIGFVGIVVGIWAAIK